MEKNKKIKGMRLAIPIAIGLLLLYSTMPRMVINQDENGFSTISFLGNIVSATENTTIGATSSGFLEIFFVNHTATPSTAYNENDSSLFEGWCNATLDPDGSGTTYYAYSNSGGFSCTIRWGVTFDILVRYRGNATVCKNATMFKDGSCRVKINASGGGITLSSAVLTNVVSYNSTSGSFLYMNAYANNGGAGYTLNKGGTCTITDIKIEFNY